jgi:hypothetical protein
MGVDSHFAVNAVNNENTTFNYNYEGDLPKINQTRNAEVPHKVYMDVNEININDFFLT